MRLHELRHSIHPSLGEDGKNKEWLSDSPSLAGGERRAGEKGMAGGGREDEAEGGRGGGGGRFPALYSMYSQHGQNVWHMEQLPHWEIT